MKSRQHTGRICGYVLAICSIAFMTTGCSNNIEQDLYPDSQEHISIAISASGYHNNILSIGSAQSATPFTVTTTTRWTVEITDCEGSWCQIVYGDNASDGAGQIGDGTFTVEAAPNRTGQVRDCIITVYAIDSHGDHIPGESVVINLDQDRQSILVDYGGDVIPYYGTNQATDPIVTVTANQEWEVSASHEWISILPGEGMEGNSFIPSDGSSIETAVSFRFSVAANPGTSTRTAEVTVSSPTSAFTPIRLNVTQEGSTETFFVTPTNVPVVPYDGSEVEIQVFSPRDNWTVRTVPTDDWATLSISSGTASNDPVTLKVTLAANPSASSRQVGIVFTRDGEMGTTTVNITQQGNLTLPQPNYDPVISAPWLVSGWTAQRVQLRAYYLSPVIEITGCGAFIHPVDDETKTMTFYGILSGDNLLIVDMEGLEPNTKYTAWPFVSFTENGQSKVKSGESDVVFTTPDRNGDPGSDNTAPGVGDNNPPVVN